MLLRSLLLWMLICCPAAVVCGQFDPGGQASAQGQVGGTGDPAGGSSNADFDSLIDLIISTVAVDTWQENGGGTAEIRPFPTGVWVDAAGLLRDTPAPKEDRSLGLALASAAQSKPVSQQSQTAANQADPRRGSPLRCVSLRRLEQEIARRASAGEPLDEAMLTLAGLRRVRYVFASPEEHDIVLAGAAGDWRVDSEQRLVAADTGEAVVRLDDLAEALRRSPTAPDQVFGCAITPRQQNLADAQAFLDLHRDKPVAKANQAAWLEQLRTTVGPQDVEVFGIAPDSRAARVLVEADRHMKLVGMGIEPGVLGVEGYLDSLRGAKKVPPMNVLRWWFALSYKQITQTGDGGGYELVGPGAKVLSENELLTLRGERTHTGQSDELTQRFAMSFSQHFAALCRRYPVYGELRNVLDLAVVATLINTQGLADRAGWEAGLLASPQRLPLPRYQPASAVESVVNHRVVDKRSFVAGVSGGVWVDAQEAISQRVDRQVEDYSRLTDTRDRATTAHTGGWWWDVP